MDENLRKVRMPEYKWDKHQLFIKETDDIKQWALKLDEDRLLFSVVFTNFENTLLVTGDYGRWSFSREFHPSGEGYVSDSYWCEKLEDCSVQKATKWSPEKSIELIQEFRNSYQEVYDDEISEEVADFLDELEDIACNSDEYHYVHHAQSCPDGIEFEDIPFGEVIHPRLKIVFDAFDEICKRLKEDEKV